MTKMMTLLAAGGTVACIGCIGTATSAQAGGWCPPAYTVVYYGPPPCCAVYGYSYPSLTYTRTTQYWPVATRYRAYRPAGVRRVRARR